MRSSVLRGPSRLVLLGLAAALLLAGCGSGAPSEADAPPAGSPGTFPVTVDHVYGRTEITAPPKRVIALGYSDADALLAVGVAPIGVTKWFTQPPPNEKWPWQEAAYGQTTPEVVAERETYNTEKIAALRPDLIVAAYSGMTEQQYQTLSGIAPVVARPPGTQPFGASWQAMTTQITKAVGQEARGRELVAGVERRIADVRAAHPQWAGKTAITAAYEGGQYYTFGSTDAKTGMLKQLGFTVPPAIDQLAQSGGAVGPERADLLNTDVLMMLGTTDADVATLKARPEFAGLPVAAQNRVIYLVSGSPATRELTAAFSYNSVLSIPVILEQLVPKLEALPPST